MNNNNNIEIESFCRYQIEIKACQAPKQAPLPILSMLSNNGNKIYIEFDIATNHLGLIIVKIYLKIINYLVLMLYVLVYSII